MPKQHDAEEAGFEEKRRQDLVPEERADGRRGLVGENRPVRSELV